MDCAPKPVEKPAQPSLQVQLPRQPVLELSDTAGMVAVARSFFVGKPPVPMTIATGAAFRSSPVPTQQLPPEKAFWGPLLKKHQQIRVILRSSIFYSDNFYSDK